MKNKLLMFLYALVVPCITWLVFLNYEKYHLDSEKYCEQGKQAYLDGDSDAAIDYYSKAIDCDVSCVEAYKCRGFLYAATKKYDEAISDYTEVIKLAPEISVVYLNRGGAYYLTGQYDKAIADCNKCIEFDPDETSGYLLRARAYQALGENEKALADYTHIIEIKSVSEADNVSLAESYFNRAQLYDQKGDHDAADADRARAIALDPELAK
ncbi:MAG: tetratricopeptide repeat protein [Phycisphaerae bacterium]|nr:tetratricopeptide repeat protein [Phycisphaerae bacterium]